MSDTKNDEKLRILQERLAQIKQKQDPPVHTSQQREAVIEVAIPKNESPTKETKPINLSWVKRIVIIGSVAYSIFYGYTNIDFNSLVPNFSEEEISEKSAYNQLEYKFNLIGNNIAIINTQNSITDEGSAKAMVNDLKVKGFKCNYFYLPENSNLTDEVYQVFIGPYENLKETNQWAKNLEAEFNIITL
jgi:hypothetical protein